LAGQGAGIVVLPEKLVGVTPEGAEGVMKIFSDAARAAHVTVIAGLSRNAIRPRRNVALVFSPEGKLVAEYEKHHLGSMLESTFASGDTPGLFAGPGAQWGVAICKDLDFPAWSHAYGQSGVLFLAVPAWDLVRNGRLHSRMAVTRGVENGFTIVRSAQEGVVTFSDAYGRVLGEQSSATDPTMVQSIPPGPSGTKGALWLPICQFRTVIWCWLRTGDAKKFRLRAPQFAPHAIFTTRAFCGPRKLSGSPCPGAES
jgi:apolipoprotein N-acyltransferase